MQLIHLVLSLLLLCVPPVYAHDTDNDVKVTELSLQKDEIFETLSTLVGKNDKNEEKKTSIKVKIEDLQEAVKILEDKEDRKKVIKALSALALLNQQALEEQGIIESISSKITETIEITSEALINSLKLLQHIPKVLKEQLSQLKVDEGYRHNTYTLLMTLLTALIGAGIVEFLVRKSMQWLRGNRTDQRTPQKVHLQIIEKPAAITPELNRIHSHIITNITPIILYGLVGYLIIYLSQPEWNSITYHGFIVMNLVIMIRSMWLLLKVLFSTPSSNDKNSPVPAQNMSLQFIVAGIQTIIIGVIFAQAGSLLGMGDLAVTIWFKIIGFGVTSLLVVAMIKNKAAIQMAFHADEENLSGIALFIAKIVEFIFRKAHIIVSSLCIAALIFWTLKLNLVAFFIAKALVFTGAISTIFILGRNWLTQYISKTKDKLKSEKGPSTVMGLNYLEGSTMNIVQSVWHLLLILGVSEVWGASPLEMAASPEVQPIISKIISVLIILIITRTLWGWADHIARSHLKGRLVGKKLVESSQFVKTVTPILKSVAHWALGFMAIILILIELGQDVRPMLYSLGVIGIAISLGAQSLVKDIINGILTLMEGNIAVGEVVTIGANTGTVESLSLRSLVLRHGNGALQTIPFSEVSNIINKSRDYASFSVSLSIAHKTDLQQAYAVLERTFTDINNDPAFGKMILEPMHIGGVDKITNTGISITASVKIKPDPSNNFAKAFNTYLQKQIDASDLYPPASDKILNINM
ncbi:mechanosensitive ion channel domain-containing protein [Candidatus Odyssella thessalonicensis]|uniref:mechanosensitive ion channel domain-containing protein n=1 Tax=Candidatus Odyssella thessalonicensis TaxID=84647 RepID=UPI000225AC1F|nr:mechanosensitive ion channel domain-containing protein [Candidatus Odyssella thessalonicensis]